MLNGISDKISKVFAPKADKVTREIGQEVNIKALLFIILFPALLWAQQMLDMPKREHSIIVTKEGYYPAQISVFEGEKLKIFLTNTQEEASCLTLPQQNLFMAARKGEISEGELYFEAPGVHSFYCPTGQIKGKITVLKRPVKISEETGRKIASDKEKRGDHGVKSWWVPREED